MFEDLEQVVEDIDNVGTESTKPKNEDCCVCINVFSRCDEKEPWKKNKKDCKDKKKDCCVCINIFVECKE